MLWRWRHVWPGLCLFGLVMLVATCQENPAEVTITPPADTVFAVPDTVFVPIPGRGEVWWCFRVRHGSGAPHWECIEADGPPPDSFP